MKDAGSGKLGIQDLVIWIPQPDDSRLNTSSMIYADVLQPVGPEVRGEEFILGPLKVIPNVKGVFPRRHALGLYLEVYDLEVDQVTKAPSVEVSYLLEAPDGSQIPIGKEHESRFPEGHSLVISKAIPLLEVAPGKYRVLVRISDLLTQRVCSLEGQIEIL